MELVVGVAIGFILGGLTATALLWRQLRMGERIIIHFHVYVERGEIPGLREYRDE